MYNFNEYVTLYKWEKSFLYKFCRDIKFLFWNPLTLFLVFGMFGIFICMLLHTTPKKYVGIVREISLWDGNAILDTKTKNGKDTIIIVHQHKYEVFEVGQTITIWTGGDLYDGFGTTKPQH